MRIKTSELTGVALDWAVAKCEGVAAMRCGAGASAYLAYVPKRTAYKKYAPSTNWAQGGPIIERMMLNEGLVLRCWVERQVCEASLDFPHKFSIGPTPLTAAMRCYAASKLGDEIDVPDTLCL